MRNNNKKLLWPISLVLASLLAFCLGNQTPHNNLLNIATNQESHLGGFEFINPLLECNMPEETFIQLNTFREKLNSLINDNLATNKASFVSVYYRDLNNGPWIGINEKEEFSPSSLLKVAALFSVFKFSEQNPDFLNKALIFNPTSQNPFTQSTPIANPMLKGQKYKVSELLEKMIVDSDNDAVNILIDAIPQEEVLKPYKDLGLKVPPINGSLDYFIKVKDYATFFRVLYNASYLNHEYSNKALEILSRTKFSNGLVSGVPKDIKVSHKFGERFWPDKKEKQLHDCGIIYYPNSPYILCVMTKGENLDTLSKIISDISSFVYQQVDKSSNKSK